MKSKSIILGTILLFSLNSQAMTGLTDGKLSKCPDKPNCVSSQVEQSDEEHFISPIQFSGTVQDVVKKIESYIKDNKGWALVKNEGNYLHATHTSAIFKWVDDIEFYFPTIEPSTLHVRSASRTGYSDLGVNRKRMEKIREFLTGK